MPAFRPPNNNNTTKLIYLTQEGAGNLIFFSFSFLFFFDNDNDTDNYNDNDEYHDYHYFHYYHHTIHRIITGIGLGVSKNKTSSWGLLGGISRSFLSEDLCRRLSLGGSSGNSGHSINFKDFWPLSREFGTIFEPKWVPARQSLVISGTRIGLWILESFFGRFSRENVKTQKTQEVAFVS